MKCKKELLRLEGNWDQGYAIDHHVRSSVCIGYNEFGYPMYDTDRSEIGELLYRVKYRSDKKVISEIVDKVLDVCELDGIDLIIPVPPSDTNRIYQPVLEIAKILSQRTGIKLEENVVQKVKKTSPLKDEPDMGKRNESLVEAFDVKSEGCFKGQSVLIFDDIYQSGSTLNAVSDVCRKIGDANQITVLTLTRTKGK